MSEVLFVLAWIAPLMVLLPGAYLLRRQYRMKLLALPALREWSVTLATIAQDGSHDHRTVVVAAYDLTAACVIASCHVPPELLRGVTNCRELQ